jgi:cation diffusion facilitator family transporter
MENPGMPTRGKSYSILLSYGVHDINLPESRLPGIKYLNRALISMLHKRWESLDSMKKRERFGSFEGFASVFVNLLLFVIKLIAGIMSGSVSLISDAFHSVSDCVTSAAVILGFRFSHMDADEEHPYGHGRIESVTTLIIAILLVIAGIELARYSIGRLFDPQEIHVNMFILVGLVVTIIIKEMLADLSYQIGKEIDSSALEADGMHHRLDALSTGLVLIAIILQGLGLQGLDSIAGVLVAFVVIWSGYDLAKSTINQLIGQAPPSELTQLITNTATSIPDVIDVHQLAIHEYGVTLHITLHIEICQSNSLLRAHDIAEKVEIAIANVISSVVTVHIDPIDLQDTTRNTIAKCTRNLLPELSALNFYDLRLSSKEENLQVKMGLSFPAGCSRETMQSDSDVLKSRLLACSPEITNIKIELSHQFYS